MTLVAEPKTARRALAHPLCAEATRGLAPWAGVAAFLVPAVLLAATADRWQGGWAETRSEVHGVLLVLVPLAAAVGCVRGGRERRRGTQELWGTAVRGPLARLLAAALPPALWVAAGYLLAAAGALLATWPYARGDRPYLDLLPTDAVVLVAAALAGHVVGRLVAWRAAAPLLAVGGYLGLAQSGQPGSGSGRYLDPALPVAEGLVPVGWQPTAMAVWTAGLAVSAVLAYAARRRYTALLPLAAATAAGALLAQTGPGPWRTNPAGHGQVCATSTSPQICVNDRYKDLLPQVTKALSGITGRLEGVRNLPVRFEDRPGEPGDGEVRLPMLTPFGRSVVRGRLTDPEQYAWEAVMALEGRDDCRELTARVRPADDAVIAYLAPSPSQDYFDGLDAKGTAAERAGLKERQAARARLASMGADERRTWLSAYFATAGDCDPSGVPAL
ncbi:hypothetical protein SAMN04487983_102328 [Streptomyces sp. yr375]|uniref:hypothetical protein n=1 Tax=Streptomyces sp. yr375 TaxID=1761906 RepID=UPI0008CF3983|nr:hypothetical protein [Streptomyces sp. yr375]SER82959.1 hypothetical protein SAMN04487983_102328 [Streptomyces sp. yr375]